MRAPAGMPTPPTQPHPHPPTHPYTTTTPPQPHPPPAACFTGLAGPGGPAGGIKLDRLLHGSLYNKKEPEGEGSVVPQAELLKRLLAKLQLHHRLVRPSDQASAALGRRFESSSAPKLNAQGACRLCSSKRAAPPVRGRSYASGGMALCAAGVQAVGQPRCCTTDVAVVAAEKTCAAAAPKFLQGPVEVVRKGQVKPVIISQERRYGRNITGGARRLAAAAQACRCQRARSCAAAARYHSLALPPAAVSHVESFALEAGEMAGVLQRKFQTSCSVSKLPGKEEKDHEIMMQVGCSVWIGWLLGYGCVGVGGWGWGRAGGGQGRGAGRGGAGGRAGMGWLPTLSQD